MEDELIDEDETLDYILYKEMKKEENNRDSKSGCLTVFIILIFPIGIFYGMLSMITGCHLQI